MSDTPVVWPEVEQAELEVIQKQGGDTNSRVGLAFSGGGIRSATFNLGVLQGLARHGLLTRVDYLSTVSGGGYIGGWFQAWLIREYYELRVGELEQRVGAKPGPPTAPLAATVEARLLALERRTQPPPTGLVGRHLLAQPAAAGSFEQRIAALEALFPIDDQAARNHELAQSALRGLQSKLRGEPKHGRLHTIREEPAPIHFLRDYSNYLTPRTGIFSADTWTVIVIYLRNLLLNALVLMLAGSSVILTVRGLARAHVDLSHWLAASKQGALLAGGCSFLAAGVSLYFALSLLGRVEDCKPRRDYVRWRVVLPLLVASVLASALLERMAKLDQTGDYWMYARQLVLVPPLVGLVFALVSSRRAVVIRIATGSAGIWLPIVAAVASIVAGFGGAWALHAAARLLGRLHEFSLLLHDDKNHEWIHSALGAPLLLCVVALMLAIQLGITGRGTTEYVREWASRLMAQLLLVAALGVGIAVIALSGPEIYNWILLKMPTVTHGLTFGWLFTTVSGLLAARGSERDQMSITRSVLISVTPHVFCFGALIFLSVLCHHLESTLFELARRTASHVVASAPDSLSWLQRRVVGALQDRAFVPVAGGIVALAVSLFLSWRIGVNEFSLHALYRNRLVRCYLGAVRGDDRRADLFTGFDIADDSLRVDDLSGHATSAQTARDSQNEAKKTHADKQRKLEHAVQASRKTALRPYLLVNATLNLVVGQRLDWQFRRASSFVFSPLFSGYETRRRAHQLPCGTKVDPGTAESTAALDEHGLYDAGYRRTQDYGGGISLGTAMAISGAALSPNMGARTTPSMAFLLTLFNLRLGWWLGNPRHQSTWNVPGPTLGLVHLLIELLGKATDTRRHIYLSDGGHFENLGLYELVRRGVRYVIVCDAGEDGEFAFSDLGNAVEKCRVDFGVEIEIDTQPLRRDPSTGRSGAHFALGQIHYELVTPGARPGTLLYIKSSLVGGEPMDVRTYATINPKFPHQSTTDQWFDETQFESYRALGEHIAYTTFQRKHAISDSETPDQIFTRLLAPNPDEDTAGNSGTRAAAE